MIQSTSVHRLLKLSKSFWLAIYTLMSQSKETSSQFAIHQPQIACHLQINKQVKSEKL